MQLVLFVLSWFARARTKASKQIMVSVKVKKIRWSRIWYLSSILLRKTLCDLNP